MALVDSVGYDLNKLRGPREYRPPHFLVSTFRNLSLIIFFSALVFVSVNLPAYWIIAKYRFSPPSEETILARSSELKENLVTQYPNNTLVIPKINLQAPVNWDTSEAEVMSALERGVVHVKGSGLPGEKKSIFITGHSSNYWWKSGDFNTIFALLPELAVDDEAFIVKDGKITRYKVVERVEVGKKEVVSYAERKEEELTLMTCYPVGTNLKRLLIIARPI
ncbi:MAG: sortase [Candidatus Berkelbacteria bacterium]|nr:sortase [Candidatus Berkelbacteria bacterium]